VFYGPTFEEMLYPDRIVATTRHRAINALHDAPLDPINLFNITWRDADNRIRYLVLPAELTGIDTPIVVLIGDGFPSGSHKVGPAYAVLMELLLTESIDPQQHTLVWPSTGNYGIGGAWVGGRLSCKSLVVLPEEMSRERFERIASYGAGVIRTPGSESNVKEIYDEVNRLRVTQPDVRVLNQFEVMGNYRFHYHVTGNTIVDLAAQLHKQGVGQGKVSAFVSAMGSAGTIAAGDRLKQVWSDHKIVGLEPIQCATLYVNGYGSHEIQGIGDKHVTWIHNVLNMDALMCIDDSACLDLLHTFATAPEHGLFTNAYGINPETVKNLSVSFGISGICNILGAIKSAKYYNLGADDLIVTVATDSLARYHSIVDVMQAENPVSVDSARYHIESFLQGADTSWIMPGDADAQQRWHNLKYYTWVEQQGKTVAELDAQRDPQWWVEQQAYIQQIDQQWLERRQHQGLG